MSNLHYISQRTAVHKSSIINLPIHTHHVGGIACGVNTDGEIMIYMITNGDDRELYDDIEDAIAWCYDMGDDDTGEDGVDGYRSNHDRIIEGAQRLLQAVDAVRKIYTSDAAAADLDWYADKAREVINTVTAEAKIVHK